MLVLSCRLQEQQVGGAVFAGHVQQLESRWAQLPPLVTLPSSNRRITPMDPAPAVRVSGYAGDSLPEVTLRKITCTLSIDQDKLADTIVYTRIDGILRAVDISDRDAASMQVLGTDEAVPGADGVARFGGTALAAPFGARVPLRVGCSMRGLAPDPAPLHTEVDIGLGTVDAYTLKPLTAP